MAASIQPKKRIKVTCPQPVFDRLAADVPPGKRRAFVGAATEEALCLNLRELKQDSPLYLYQETADEWDSASLIP